jgi:DNA processing protein
MDVAERDALVLLTLVPGLGPRTTRRALDALGSAQAVVAAGRKDLTLIEGVGVKRAAEVHAAMDEAIRGGALEREKSLIDEYGVTLLVLGQPGYPRLLSLISDPPPVLFVRGEIREGDALALAIVGARKCTTYGREQADRFAALAVGAGLCVVSGGAYGIDAAAHRAAVRVGGRTIAVLGSGLANPYPLDHVELFDQIAEAGAGRGAVISELPMTTPPMRDNFPSRNRLISGLSLGVLVVEASLRSGALITARLSAEDHGREVMALPGRVDSEASGGCHKILREGWATLVTCIPEVLDALGDAGRTLKARVTEPDPEKRKSGEPSLFEQGLTETQRRVVTALDEPRAIDELSTITQLAVPMLQADLMLLQIRGMVGREGGKFVRKR